MLRKLTSSFLVLTLLLSIPIAVVAQEEESTESSSGNSQSSTSSEDALDQVKKTIEERQAERQARITERIDAATAKRIAARCKAAQEVVASALTRVNEVYTARQNTYTTVVGKINSLISRLETNGIDVTEVKTSATQAQTLIDQFFIDFDAFVQALDDTTSLDCENDPEGFKLALDDARAQRAGLVEQAAAIRAYIQTEVKTDFIAIRDQLAGDGVSDQSNDSTTDNPSDDATITNTDGAQ